jgi:catechol 2,3-dioxygenase-like lactoylglutathione lyase family enzyme
MMTSLYIWQREYVEATMKSLESALKVHVSLTVKDLTASVAFYRRLFGIEPVKVRPGYAKFDVQHPPVNFSLNEGAAGPGGTLSHLGVQVPSTQDVVEISRQWRTHGLEPREEMQTDCCYALQDKAWVEDPDGNQWEVFTVLQETSSASNSCCSGNVGVIPLTQIAF